MAEDGRRGWAGCAGALTAARIGNGGSERAASGGRRRRRRRLWAALTPAPAAAAAADDVMAGAARLYRGRGGARHGNALPPNNYHLWDLLLCHPSRIRILGTGEIDTISGCVTSKVGGKYRADIPNCKDMRDCKDIVITCCCNCTRPPAPTQYLHCSSSRLLVSLSLHR